MDAKSLVTAKQRATFLVSGETQNPKIAWSSRLEGLTPGQRTRHHQLVADSHARLDAIMISWPYPWINKPRTPHYIGEDFASKGGETLHQRGMYGSEWVPVDTDRTGGTIEVQVRSYVWRDDEEWELYKERRQPHLGLWLRLNDSETGACSDPVELFDFPGIGSGRGACSLPRDVRFMGSALHPDAPQWEKLTELLDHLETEFGLVPQSETTSIQRS